MADDTRNRDAILRRLSPLNGQRQGVSRWVKESRDCVDILNQTAAIRSALRAVARLLIEDHARCCAKGAIQPGDQDRQRIKCAKSSGCWGRCAPDAGAPPRPIAQARPDLRGGQGQDSSSTEHR